MSVFDVESTWWGAPLASLLSLQAAYPNSTSVTEYELAFVAVVVAVALAHLYAAWRILRAMGAGRGVGPFGWSAVALWISVLLWAKLQVDTVAGAFNPAVAPLDAIPEHHGRVTPEVFTVQYRGRPVVARGAVSAEELKRWKPAALAEAYGAPDSTAAMQLGNMEQESAEYGTYSLGEFFAHLEDDAWVRAHTKPDGSVPYLAEDNRVLRTGAQGESYMNAISTMLRRTLLSDVNSFHMSDIFLWAGPKGSKTGLHADWDPLNLLHQLHGVKTVYLFHPSDTPHCYPSEKYDLGATVAQVNPFKPDYDAFPDYAKARALKVVLHPGDVLQVPPGWMHYAHCFDAACVSLSGQTFSLAETLATLPCVFGSVLHRFGLYRLESTAGYLDVQNATFMDRLQYTAGRLAKAKLYVLGEEDFEEEPEAGGRPY